MSRERRVHIVLTGTIPGHWHYSLRGKVIDAVRDSKHEVYIFLPTEQNIRTMIACGMDKKTIDDLKDTEVGCTYNVATEVTNNEGYLSILHPDV